MSRVPPPLPAPSEPEPLPRSEVGPFLILGIDKDADRETIEAAWAQRLIWARKNMTKTPLEDINWARDVMMDRERRIRADATSLNVDTVDGVLKGLRERFQGKDGSAAGGRCLDVEKNLADFQPDIQIPDVQEIRAQIETPPIPREVPAVQVILEEYVRRPLDPWDDFQS